MMKQFLGAALAAVILSPTSQAMADGPVVVELFTSQGCSSCPPADKLLGEVAQRNDVIALSLHVDYWDYLGWKDEFADPAHTKRQQGYAKAAGKTMMFTPQMIIGGKDGIVGNEAMKLAEAISAHKAAPNPVVMQLSREGGKLRITAQRVGDVPGQMLVQLVRYSPERTAKIRAGENAGHSITYHNVVETLEAVARWNGGADLDMVADAQGDAPAAVIIQDGASGPVLAAARID